MAYQYVLGCFMHQGKRFVFIVDLDRYFCAIVSLVFLYTVIISRILFHINNFHAFIWYQVFLSNKNNLHTFIWYQVFLSNKNNLYTFIWLQVVLSNKNDLRMVSSIPI